jgi:hypothetical protein
VRRNLTVQGALSLPGDVTANRFLANNSVVIGGAMTIGSNYIQFPSDCCAWPHTHKLRLWGTEYSLGMENGTIRYNTAQVHRWYYGGNAQAQTRIMEIDQNQMRMWNGAFQMFNAGGAHYVSLQGAVGDRNRFRDGENRGWVWVGAAWNIPGIYSESESLVLGAASGQIYVGPPNNTTQHLNVGGNVRITGTELSIVYAGGGGGHGDGGRALRHDPGDVLSVNYAGEFSGGTLIHGNARVTGQLTVNGGIAGGLPGNSAGRDACPGGWWSNWIGDMCMLGNWGAQAQPWTDHWCKQNGPNGGHLCTDTELGGARAWLGAFGNNDWYADVTSDNVATFRNGVGFGYWVDHDGDANRANHRNWYCCIYR